MANAVARAHVPSPISSTTSDPALDCEAYYRGSSPGPISRKKRGQTKRRSSYSSNPTSIIQSSTNSATSATATPSAVSIHYLSTTIPTSMPASKDALQKTYPLLVCSLGNPGSAYAQTPHSAGHIVTSHIVSMKVYLPFTQGLSGLVSRPNPTTYRFNLLQGFKKVDLRGAPEEDDWTFWQSTSLMNVSGMGVKRAWTAWERDIRKEGLVPRLVVVHDELEAGLGKITVRDGAASAKGHNGIKSCQASLGHLKWWRIGVGIGRPESREPAVVSKFVLRKLAGREMKTLQDASIKVVDALREIEAGKS